MSRVQVGSLYVDAGIIMLGDPCYTLPDDGSDHIGDWSTFCDALHKSEKEGVYKPFMSEHTAIVVDSGLGDGEYPVYVEYEDMGSWGKRIKSVTVEFLMDED